MNWSIEEAEKAGEKKAFIRVTSTNKKSLRHLSGAERMWNKGEGNEVYLLDHRISGIPEDIKKSLLEAGYDKESIDEALSNAITSKNYQTTKKSDYEAELKAWNEFKQARNLSKKKTASVDDKTLERIASNIKEAHIVMLERIDTSPRRTGKGKTLLDRFSDISGKEAKMIDVSDMREDGTGTRVQNKPTTERGQKVFLEGIPILSKNVDAYLRALKKLFEANQFDSPEEYEKTAKMAQAKFGAKKKSGKG